MKKYLVSIIFLFSLSVSAIPVELNNVPLRDFVSWYSKITGRAVIVSPDVKGTVTVYSADVRREELPQFFTSVLRANGYDLSAGNPGVVQKYTADNYEYSDSFSDDDFDSLPQGRPVSPEGGFFNSPGIQANLITQTYPVNNVRAKDLAPVIDVFLKGDNIAGTKVFPFDGANILAVTASASQHKELKAFFPSVDVPRIQVLIESVIFETSAADGFDFSFAAGDPSGRSLAGGVNTDRLGKTLSAAGGSFGIFNGNILALSVKALESSNKSTLLSMPRILTMSGQPGIFTAGQNVPFVTGRITGESASVNNPFQTIERRDVGISLQVVPVVTPGGLLIMDVKTSADSISDSQVASDIITNTRAISTTVQLKSGQTVLLGGMVDNRDSQAEASVPWVSKIPLIGAFFTSESTNSSKRTLYMLIRARVVNPL
ncbi:secretin N-terminal domain-containing protein [Enterobacter bugandensis]|uniref:secretin N-terminal domain-containing protein n=1 Tax=Enterobacter bugandensis TaxID=881260 RepID=UPI00235F63EA|nr:secretin N-terminal domain-containing protein [Enterobacter bugandensis]